MEEVENGITGLASLDARRECQADASVRSAQRAFDIASDRYKGGVDTYLDVITAEQSLLDEPAPGGADSGTAVQHRGVLGQGARRRLEPVDTAGFRRNLDFRSRRLVQAVDGNCRRDGVRLEEIDAECGQPLLFGGGSVRLATVCMPRTRAICTTAVIAACDTLSLRILEVSSDASFT